MAIEKLRKILKSLLCFLQKDLIEILNRFMNNKQEVRDARMKVTSSFPSSPNDGNFKEKLSKLLDATFFIDMRVSELEEFHRQWQNLSKAFEKFEKSESRQIQIQNIPIYHSFYWDKYHVVLDDLYSLLRNQHGNQNSVCSHANLALKIKPIEEYINPNFKMHHIYLDETFPDPKWH